MKEFTFEEKVEQFSRFISLLSGELNVNVTFGTKKEGAGIVLPDISNLDEKHLNFLYALCLREAGSLAKSKRMVGSYLDFKTQNDVLAAMQMESARIERYLIRKFAGAGEILEYHWAIEAHDPELCTFAFGFNPKKATAEQTFFSAIKWSLLGRPKKFKWENLFPKDLWEESVSVLNSEEVLALLNSTVLRTWEDSKVLGSELLQIFYKKTHRKDSSPSIVKSESFKEWEKAQKILTNDLPNRLKPLLEEKEALQEKIKKLKEQKIERYKEKGIDIKQVRQDLAEVRAQNKVLKSVFKPLSKLNDMKEKLENKESSLNALFEKNQNHQNALQEREAGLDEKAQQLLNESMNREEAINEREMLELNKLQEKKENLEQQLKEIEDLMSQEELSSKKKESLEAKKASMQEKIENLEQKMDNVREKSEQARVRAEKMRERAEEIEKKKEELSNRATQKQENAAAKENELKENIENLKNTAQSLENELKEASQAQGLKMKDLDKNQLAEKIESLNQEQEILKNQVEKITSETTQIKQLEEQAQKLDDQARMKMHNTLQEVQEKMNKAGIDCKIADSLDEMEGWNEANQAQCDFDSLATKELGRPVINGSGGGRGHRDLLTQIELAAEGIGEIDPNQIFQGIERLSPLSGFSESGLREGEGGLSKNHQETLGSFSQSRHTVWSKQFDKVIPTPYKNMQEVIKLKQELTAPIRKVQDIFARKMKPSFKLRFKGGREEGDLDARAIWKLAAHQGEDFFETSFKKPEKKSSAVILADLSGSCASWGDNANSLIQGMSLILSEGLSKVNIDHEILGYFAPIEEQLSNGKAPLCFNRKTCRLETWVAKSFSEKSIAGISGLQLQQADNSDGESLRIAIDRIRRRPGKTKIIFMLSDGKPFMHDADASILDEDLRSALQYAASQKIVVWGVGLSEHHPVFGEQYIAIKSLSELPAELDRRFK